jgi:hypothetical protein
MFREDTIDASSTVTTSRGRSARSVCLGSLLPAARACRAISHRSMFRARGDPVIGQDLRGNLGRRQPDDAALPAGLLLQGGGEHPERPERLHLVQITVCGPRCAPA